ncbi:transmembrane protein, putative (macronuclear) [Tetrahymena thermophila SB210]|uniref:Transmembrane protein, putative n=1 Tax=Tetrahymena thermophila (strain SB210) TaxID=312017 RepID=W7XHN8_TETTS|nr:transmembrane protein, putative [Tetrahymena thermophila SB210]EWS72664.1 transmembrane protein, putative [Tetrahymena thermophila SB210]|eukprot:XP_012654789.1 transmembrane protein, putative [Tetrahymena thermophila SB210]
MQSHNTYSNIQMTLPFFIKSDQVSVQMLKQIIFIIRHYYFRDKAIERGISIISLLYLVRSYSSYIRECRVWQKCKFSQIILLSKQLQFQLLCKRQFSRVERCVNIFFYLIWIIKVYLARYEIKLDLFFVITWFSNFELKIFRNSTFVVEVSFRFFNLLKNFHKFFVNNADFFICRGCQLLVIVQYCALYNYIFILRQFRQISNKINVVCFYLHPFVKQSGSFTFFPQIVVAIRQKAST